MLLLKLLSEQDMHGYRLSRELKNRSDGRYSVLEGSMYPILHRLADQKLISSYQDQTEKRRTRLYYHIEPSGRCHLAELTRSYYAYADLISFLLQSNAGESYKN